MWLWFVGNGEVVSIVFSFEVLNKIFEVDVEILIMGFKDVYDKKIKKINEGLEYCLENLEVIVVIWVFDEIISVCVYIWRCVEVVIRIYDIIGRWCSLGFWVLMFIVIFVWFLLNYIVVMYEYILLLYNLVVYWDSL